MKKAIILGFCVAANLSMVNIAQANDETGGRFLSQLTGSEQGSLTASEAPAAKAPAATRGQKAHGSHAKALGYETGSRNGLRDLIGHYAAENGVPFGLADAVVRIESRYNPRVSNGGALGLMQIKPATARGVGFSGPASALFTADTNLRYGMRYLAQAYRMSGGNTCLTVMRYQSGHYAKGMNGANRAYCNKATAIMASL